MKIIVILLSFYGSIAMAQLDEHSEKALGETQQLLKDKTQRNESIAKDPKQKAADDSVRNLVGGDEKMTDDVYALAAEVFTNVVSSANGDAKKMEQMMAEFQRNPAAFASTWTPAQKAKLKALADKMGKPGMAPRQ